MTQPLVVTECWSGAAENVWAEYTQAIGLEALRDAYGPHWPRPMIEHERVWTFALHGARIAWGSLYYEAAERVMWHAHGIWPAYQEQGVTRDVSRWLVDWAFTGAFQPVAVCAKILETNPRYQSYFKRRQHDPAFAWRYAGAITMPWPGYDVYCFSRARWQLEQAQRPAAIGSADCSESGSNSAPAPGRVRDMSG